MLKALAESQQRFKYHAFISYRHADNKEDGRRWASWLHQALETYQVPEELAGSVNGRGDVIPDRIFPIFVMKTNWLPMLI